MRYEVLMRRTEGTLVLQILTATYSLYQKMFTDLR